jgi:hypothetical protein
MQAKEIKMKKLTLKKVTVSALNSIEQNGILGGVVAFTYRPGDDCGRSGNFTYVAACPATFVCGTDVECGGGGNPPATSPAAHCR